MLTFTNEPVCHWVIRHGQLTPDAFVEVDDPAEWLKFACFLGVDHSADRAEKIQDKCARYWEAFQRWAEAFFSYAVLGVPDQPHAREIPPQGLKRYSQCFLVCRLEAFTGLLGRAGVLIARLCQQPEAPIGNLKRTLFGFKLRGYLCLE